MFKPKPKVLRVRYLFNAHSINRVCVSTRYLEALYGISQ